MPYITRNDQGQIINIHYEVHGQGEPIVMHHGNGNRLSDWHHLGFVDALQDDMQLILIDLRGYGESSKPHDPAAYSLKSRVEDTLAVLDELGLEQVHCFGGSFSTSFNFWFAKYSPQRFKSYIFATPGTLFEQISQPEIKQAMLEGAAAYLAKLEDWFGPFEKPFLRETFLANDGAAIWASNSSEWFDYRDYVKYIDKPCLLYTGEKEPINAKLAKLAQQLPDCEYVILPGLEHCDAYWRSDITAPLIKQFVLQHQA